MSTDKIVEYTYLKDNITEIGIIKENENVRISKVEFLDNACIYKIYYGRDLSEIYARIQECKLTRCLAQIYDVLYYDGNTHILEERLSGETLSEYIANRGCMDEEVFGDVIEEICEALDVLHNNNPPILHRDIKPSNIMLLKDGSIKLFDFDAARNINGEKDRDTVLLGTKAYASPEHLGFCETGVYSDIYSLGITMYELLTGEILKVNVNKCEYKCGDRYKQIIEKCVQLDFTKRYSSIRDLLLDLRKVKIKKNEKGKLDFDEFRDFLYDAVVNDASNALKRFTFENDSRYEKKLRQVMKMIKNLCNNEVVKMIYDDSITGNAKVGMVLTNQRIIDTWMNYSVKIEDVEDIELGKLGVFVKTADKEIKISCTGGNEIRKALADSLRRLCNIQEA